MRLPHRGILRQDKGQVLIIVLIISIIVFVTVSALTLNVSSSLSQAIATQASFTAQTTATQAVGWLTSQLNNNPSYIQSRNSIFTPTTPFSLPSGASSYTATFSSPWEELSSAGVQTCPANNPSSAFCFRFAKVNVYFSTVSNALSNATTQGTNVPLTEQSVTSYIETRNDCSAGTTNNCIYNYFSSDVAHRNFYDYLYFTNYETLDPSLYPFFGSVYPGSCTTSNTNPGCIPVSYQSDYAAVGGGASIPGDVLNGAIRTNSPTVFTCVGSTSYFQVPLIEATGTRVVSPTAQGCATPPPSSTVLRSVKAIPLPSSVSSLAQIAYPYWFPSGASFDFSSNGLNGSGGINVSFTANAAYLQNVWSALSNIIQNNSPSAITTITPQGGGNDLITIQNMGIPPSGVLYDMGNVSNVVGDLSGNLTIAANGNIGVAQSPSTASPVGNNLIYNCAQAANTPDVIPNNCRDMLGLDAQGNIAIGPSSVTSSTNGGAMTPVVVDAAMIALGNSQSSSDGMIYALGWDQPSQHSCLSTTAPKLPVLTINGALIAQYRGVFGQYISNTSNQPCLVSGFFKHFTWDTRLAHQQPPYALQPVASNFASLGIRHVSSAAVS